MPALVPGKKISWSQITLIIVLALGVVLWFNSKQSKQKPQQALQPCPKTTLNEQVRVADFILIGEVFAVVPANNLADVLIVPKQIFKGTPSVRGITIVARPVASNVALDETGDLHFASGKPPYLLFLKKRTDEKYDTSKCFGSRELGDGLKEEERMVLGVSSVEAPVVR